MKCTRAGVYVALILFGFGSHIVPMRSGLFAQRLLVKDYSTQDGLPDSRVAPIIQDQDGYMWFGTQAGLTRYDGSQFTTMTQASDIPGIFGRDIAQDHTGAIWLAYTGIDHGGLVRLWNGKQTRFGTFNGLAGDQEGCVIEDAEHNIWVGTMLNRIRFLDSARVTFAIDSFPGRYVTAFCLDHTGKLWLGGVGLSSFSHGSFKDELAEAGATQSITVRPYGIYESSNGEIWAGGYEGAAMITGGKAKFFSIADGLPERGVWSFCEDKLHNFWVGTPDGLYRLHRSKGSFTFIKEESFGDAVVYDMCLDREGNVWFACSPGARKLMASDLIVSFPDEDKLATQGFGPIVQAGDGGIYFGSRNSGLYYLKGNSLVSGRSVQPFSQLTYTTILADSRKRTWFGLRAGGVFIRDGEKLTHHDLSNGLPSSNVNVISKTGESCILIGTAAGLSLADTSGTIHPLKNAELDSLTIFDIRTTSAVPPGSPENIWLATMHGIRLVHLKGDSIQTVQRLPALAHLDNVIVYELLVGTDGTLWCGTDGLGLARFDGSSMTVFTTTDGLVGNRVLALAKDSIGTMWIGTSSGLSQFDGQSFKNFTYDQGFAEIGLHGLTVDRDSNLWVSSFPGITKIRPTRFYKSNLPPPVYITDVEVDTLRVKGSQRFEVPPNHAVVTFRYAGLSFSDEEQVRYKYKLEGFDRGWSSPVLTREVRYTHLPSGEYTFLVLARSRDGIWSAEPAGFVFSVLPPIWARWWFMLTIVLVLIGLVYSAYRYRLNKLLELERTRSRIAMDLHDDIGSSLARISVLSEVARYQERSYPAEAGDTISRIGDTARELIDSLGDIVWSVDPKHDDLQNIIRRIVQFGQETCEGRKIQFETEIDGEYSAVRLSLDRRRDVFLIFKEAVHNAVKHSNARHVVFRVVPERSDIVLLLSDDGAGFDSGKEQSGNGLRSMRERGSRVGRLTIESTPGRGTTVSVRVKTV